MSYTPPAPQLDEWIDRILAAASFNQEQLQNHSDRRSVLRVQGGASKDFYGNHLRGDAVSTRGLTGIVSYEPSELVVTVRSGMLLGELEATLAEKNQSLAFEPPHFGPEATVGGMVAAGLSGPSRASVGGVRDYVLGARFVNGRGEHLTFGGQVMKNVAGYDVSRVLAGSWGTLGLITEVSLKVLPFAPAQATLMCRLPAPHAQATALELLHRWGGQPLPLNASAIVFDGSAAAVADHGDYLFVRLRGAVAAVNAAVPRMVVDVQAQGGSAVAMDNAQASSDWQASREHRLAFFTTPPPLEDPCLWRLSVPQTAAVLELPFAQYIEWHGAQRWLWASAADAPAIFKAAQQAGGHAMLFRRERNTNEGNAARHPAPAVFAAMDTVQQRLQDQLQQQVDPYGVFATQRISTPANPN